MSSAIALVIHPGFQLLDAAGPAAAFEIAGRLSTGYYDLSLIAPIEGRVESSSGIPLDARKLHAGPFDTIVVAGGEIIRDMDAVRQIIGWLSRAQARRIASVCSGAFLLAEAGLLNGRRATTHWASSDHFRQRYPQVTLEPDRIFIQDGNIWTSAGISAGIDLALALIEADLGPDIARRTAQQLVVHHRRPGGQSQFSALVELGGASGRFGDTIAWIRAHLADTITVERLADQAAMSPRNFARAFLRETGSTPAKAVERLRLEAARVLVENGCTPLDRIAQCTGFADPGRMRRAFLRNFGQPPQALRRAAHGSNSLPDIPCQTKTDTGLA
ncbi:GlxA family transcriptional regulator [Allopusillimonas soli]|uniref:GlxA family transcriptional regulator n=1 Tax=Allopusillimonas soli TaxID=659016 RepID=A0A853F8W8_9BURK|nr:GlxA family transcriptional regulator [Allopusillimonas soli]NYT36248.1 GlxA family transcriptional regulator [Allopusillimonas soli]TEA76573.1 GlxA family transcriptional regulator [Allopusillimonas soli]